MDEFNPSPPSRFIYCCWSRTHKKNCYSCSFNFKLERMWQRANEEAEEHRNWKHGSSIMSEGLSNLSNRHVENHISFHFLFRLCFSFFLPLMEKEMMSCRNWMELFLSFPCLSLWEALGIWQDFYAGTLMDCAEISVVGYWGR